MAKKKYLTMEDVHSMNTLPCFDVDLPQLNLTVRVRKISLDNFMTMQYRKYDNDWQFTLILLSLSIVDENNNLLFDETTIKDFVNTDPDNIKPVITKVFELNGLGGRGGHGANIEAKKEQIRQDPF